MLTLTVKINQQSMDLMVQPNQRMSEVLRVLRENGKIFFRTDRIVLYSHRNQRYVNQRLTFAQAGIYSGDVLELR